MKLDKLRLENFRCFDDLEIGFDSALTVLVAENGQGKSSVLDAIRIALWPFVSGFDLARNAFNDPGNAIAIDDARVVRLASGDMARQLPVRVSMTGVYDDSDQPRNWTRYRDREARATKTRDGEGVATLKNWVSGLQTAIRDPQAPPRDLPVFGYYGTGRLWSQKKLTEATRGVDDTKSTDFYVRSFGYRNCLDPASTYKHFSEWFAWASESYQEKRLRALDRPGSEREDDLRAASTPIKVVQEAINAFLFDATGWRDLEYSIADGKKLVLTHEPGGERLMVDQLSDGIRSVLAMVGDLAYRCVKLNPHLGARAAMEAQGVVMIDEIDMHLHPRWQQTILGQLRQAFPNLQFIVTTHSPQVITTVRREAIRVIRVEEGRYLVETPDFSPLAHPANDALARIMGVDPIADLPIRDRVAAYEELVRNGAEHDQAAQSLLAELNAAGYQIHEADLDLWRFLARRAGGGARP